MFTKRQSVDFTAIDLRTRPNFSRSVKKVIFAALLKYNEKFKNTDFISKKNVTSEDKVDRQEANICGKV
jgi:hypothetical protein